MSKRETFILAISFLIIAVCIFGCCCTSNNKAAENNVKTETTVVQSAIPINTVQLITAPSIGGITVVVESDGAKVSWSTDRLTRGWVSYGESNGYGKEAKTSSYGYSTYHSVVLSGLCSRTTYHYQVGAEDINGNTIVSGDQIFVTPYQTSHSDCYCGRNYYNCYYGSCSSYHYHRTYDRYDNYAVGYPIPASGHDSPQREPSSPSGPIKTPRHDSSPPPSYPVRP